MGTRRFNGGIPNFVYLLFAPFVLHEILCRGYPAFHRAELVRVLEPLIAEKAEKRRIANLKQNRTEHRRGEFSPSGNGR